MKIKEGWSNEKYTSILFHSLFLLVGVFRYCTSDVNRVSIVFDMNGHFTLSNYHTYLTSKTYLMMTVNSVLFAFLITLMTLLISYPTAYFLSKLKHRQLLLLLVVLPTWINLLLKAYAFIGIFSANGSVNDFLSFIGIGQKQLLFTDFSFMFVAAYIELPFMIMPILMP